MRSRVRYVKASVYLPEPLAEALLKAYHEANSLGEAVRMLVYECLAGVLEIREFTEEALALAASELLRIDSKKYSELIHVIPKQAREMPEGKTRLNREEQ